MPVLQIPLYRLGTSLSLVAPGVTQCTDPGEICFEQAHRIGSLWHAKFPDHRWRSTEPENFEFGMCSWLSCKHCSDSARLTVSSLYCHDQSRRSSFGDTFDVIVALQLQQWCTYDGHKVLSTCRQCNQYWLTCSLIIMWWCRNLTDGSQQLLQLCRVTYVRTLGLPSFMP